MLQARSSCCSLLFRALQAPGRRTIFSDDFLGVTTFNEHKSSYLKETSGRDLEKIRSVSLGRDPVLLLSDDIKRIMYAAKDLQSATEVAGVLRRYVQRSSEVPNATALRMNRQLVVAFLSMCHSLATLESATALWSDKSFLAQLRLLEDGTLSTLAPNILLNYAQLMYNAKRYQEVLDFYDEWVLAAAVQSVPINLLTLTMAACLKLNTAASFERASQLVSHAQDDQNMHYLGRAGCIYSLLATRQSQLVQAYEALAFVSGSNIRLNLQVYVLARLERFDDALRLMEEAVKETDEPSFKRKKAKFSTETIKALTTGVEKANDETIKKKVAVLFNRLDNVAEISRQSLEDMALSVITSKTEKWTEGANVKQRDYRRPIDPSSSSKDTQRFMA